MYSSNNQSENWSKIKLSVGKITKPNINSKKSKNFFQKYKKQIKPLAPPYKPEDVTDNWISTPIPQTSISSLKRVSKTPRTGRNKLRPSDNFKSQRESKAEPPVCLLSNPYGNSTKYQVPTHPKPLGSSRSLSSKSRYLLAKLSPVMEAYSK